MPSSRQKKSKGSRFIVSEMTMNGWLKLEHEPGWLAAHLRGVQDIGEVAAPLETDPMLELAVPVYQPQGMVCLEVVFKTGVPVRETPSRKAKTVATLKCGEYVFAHTQNFDGWLKLSGKPDGWVLANDSDWGELLRRRRRMNDVDLWALSDAWAAARGRPGTGRSMGLSGKEVEALKELEERTVMEAKALWQEHRNNKEYLVTEGYLTGQDLLKTETWMRQRVFAHVLEKKSKTGEGWLRELISGFKLSTRVPPLPGIQGEQEEDDYYAEQQAQQNFPQAQSFSQGLRKGFMSGNGNGAVGGNQGHGAFDPAFEGTKPFEYKGKVYTMAPNGVLFDPPNQVPMGIWNPDTQRLDPAAGMMPGCPYPAISYLGRTYILLPDQRLLDPETEEIVGTFNRETNEMDLKSPTLLQEVGARKEMGTDPAFANDGEPVDMQEYIERGNQMVKAGRFKAAAGLFSEALKACSQLRAVDLDLEVDIIKSRAKCWKALGCFSELQEDASKVLKLTGNRDSDALQWLRAAEEGLAHKSHRAPPEPREAPPMTGSANGYGGFGAKCSQCNGLASKCAQCGAGMEKCGYCGQPVSRANCCSRCHCTYYCGRECQRSHWKVHKLVCQSALE
mmetsp:Transcript_30793/g.69249  ORF Transcript_30793/g.69249 Transcript_30793/m.69249 type:complete len:618 (-) Transcript_30793:203-2056(-)